MRLSAQCHHRLPLQSRSGTTLPARNTAAPPFGDEYLDLVRDFADHAAIALTLATARRYARERALVADRERIARNLNDQIIQRVFAVGLDLQGVIARLCSPQLAARVAQSVDELQAVIDDIRRTHLHPPISLARRSDFPQRIQDAVARLTDNRDEVTTLRMAGATTTVRPGRCGAGCRRGFRVAVAAETFDALGHAEAVVVEALSNAVRQEGHHHRRPTSTGAHRCTTRNLGLTPDGGNDPFTFNILRYPNPHLGFGGTGAHYCLGAHLARMTIDLMFNAIADHIPDLTPSPHRCGCGRA